MKQLHTVEVAGMTQSCARDLTNRIKSGVNDVAEMLHRAHEGRAWEALEYASWKAYCQTEFQMSKQRAFQLLDFVEIKNTLKESTIVDSSGLKINDLKEGQVRPLAKLDPEDQPDAWEKAVEMADGEEPTAQDVEAAVVVVKETKARGQQLLTAPGFSSAEIISDGEVAKALLAIKKACGKETEEAIRRGTLALGRAELLRLVDRPDAEIKGLIDVMVAKHWKLSRALGFVSNMVDEGTTVTELILHAIADGGTIEVDINKWHIKVTQ